MKSLDDIFDEPDVPAVKNSGNPIESLFDIIDSSDEEPSPSTIIMQAKGSNPDHEAEAQILAKKVGLPASVVSRNLEDVKLKDGVAELDRIFDSVPTLSKFILDNPDAAWVAHDDIIQLSTVANLSEQLKVVDFRKGGPSAPPRDFDKEAYDRLSDGEKAFITYGDISRSISSEAIKSPGNILSGLGEAYEAIGSLGEEGLNYATGGYSRALDQKLTEYIGGLPWWVKPDEILKRPGNAIKRFATSFETPEERRNLITDIAGGVGGVGGEAATVILTGGGSKLLTLTMLAAQGSDVQAERVEKARKSGSIEGDIAILGGAAITGMLEKVGLWNLFERLPPKIKQDTLRIITDISFAGGIEAAQELAEGLMQNLLEYSLYNPDVKIVEGLDRDALTAVGTGSTVRALVNLFVKGRGVGSDLKDVETKNGQLRSLIEAAGQSKLADRSPELFEKMIDESSDGREILFDAEGVQDYFRTLDPGVAQELAGKFGILEPMGMAVRSGGDVSISLARVVTGLRGTEHLDPLLDHARHTEGAFSKKEAVDFENEIIAAKQKIEVEAPLRDSKSRPEDIVFENIKNQLVNTGMAQDVAHQNATLHKAS